MDNNMAEKVKRLNDPKFDKEVFNVELFLQTLDKEGMSKTEIANRIGVHPTTITYWVSYRGMPDHDSLKKICRELPSLRKDNLILRGKRKNEYKTTLFRKYLDENKAEEDEVDESDQSDTQEDGVKFRRIESQRVDDCFETINHNILLLATNAVKSVGGIVNVLNDVIEKQNDLMSMFCEMSVKINSLEARIGDGSQDNGSEIRSIPKYVSSEVEEMLKTFSSNVEFGEFRKQIVYMSNIYSDIKGMDSNSVLSEVYKKMTRVYGVVFDQLKKEYKESHGSSAPSTLHLVYDSDMYRSIMHSILVDMVSEAAKEYEKSYNEKQK